MAKERHRFISSLYSAKRERRTQLAAALLTTALASFVIWNAAQTTHVWTPSNVPVAFWAWRSTTPGERDLAAAARETGARTLFLHAGQIAFESSRLVRTRAPDGRFPQAIEVHLVYSATRDLLARFERVDAASLTEAVLSALDEDLRRARLDGAEVTGVQLDFDVPTRLLSKYAETLVGIRRRLPNDLRLSITGLPTWMGSEALLEPLSVCDFWIPQCYGPEIPERLDQRVAITSPRFVAKTVARASALQRPFYAGLAAYGYAIHYSREGQLLGLRGDLDPLLIVRNRDLDLVERHPFETPGEPRSSVQEWRAVYRAIRDVVIRGTPVRSGESLALHIPTAASLSACTREVRQEAGQRLLGICIFRLPTRNDPTTLTLPEMTSALNDIAPRFALNAQVDPEVGGKGGKAVLTLRNTGTAGLRFGESLSLLIRFPPGRLLSVSAADFASATPVFESSGNALPCASLRANATSLSTDWWPPGSKSSVTLEFRGGIPGEIVLDYIASMEDGSRAEGALTVRMTGTQ